MQSHRYAILALAGLLWVGCDGRDSTAPPPASDGDPGAELATTAVGNCIGAPPADAFWPGDQISYSNNRVFLESQGWWGKDNGGTVPKYGQAEHIHVGMCFPLQQTVTGTKTMKVLVRGHNLPLGSIIKSTSLHDAGQDAAGQPPFVTITWNDTVKASDNGNVTLWREVGVNTAAVPSGQREFRNLTIVVRPPESGQAVGAQLHVSSGWCWITSNGGTTGNSGGCGTAPLSTVGRGWYDCFEYKLAETRDWGTGAVKTYPFAGIPGNASYTVKVAAQDGAGLDHSLTGWEVRLDPNFHAGDNGRQIAAGSTPVFGQSVPLNSASNNSLMTPGVHKLAVISFANANCTQTTPITGGIVPQKGEVSAILMVPIKVN